MAYGIGNFLGNAVTSAAAPAVGAGVTSSLSEELKEWLLKMGLEEGAAGITSDIGGGTFGALAGAAIGAGIGGLTGGKSGAAGSALTGGLGGAFGAYKNDEIGDALNFTGRGNTTSAQGPTEPHADLGKYFDVAGKGMIPMFMLGSSITGNMDDEEWYSNKEKEQKYRDYMEEQQAKQFVNNMYRRGFAEGGEVSPVQGISVSNDNGPLPVTIKLPPWVSEDMINSGGISDLTQNYAGGGLLDGEGDGMSDSIPASVEGKMPIRVADGEYAVPKPIAEQYGDKLKSMMESVRKAAYPEKGKQIAEDAAQRAFIQSLSGVKA